MEIILIGAWTQGGFLFGVLAFGLKIYSSKKNFIGAVLSRLVSDLQKPFLSGIKPKTFCHICFCNLLSEAKNIGFSAFVLPCSVSELQELPSLAIEYGTLFRSYETSALFSLLVLKE
jgi:hypothetical protein